MLNNCAGGTHALGHGPHLRGELQPVLRQRATVTDPSDARGRCTTRYGLTGGATRTPAGRRIYARFDLAQEPNEPFRFGWVVEIDPYDPTSTPVKRTALGRFKHEGCDRARSPTTAASSSTCGDDERFDYIYKFVTAGHGTTAATARPNMDLLDNGTLYVAKFNDDGTGTTWLPLVARPGTA